MVKKIAYLGTGVWGFCLSRLLAKKGYKVVAWSVDASTLKHLKLHRSHPQFPAYPIEGDLTFTDSLEETLEGAEMLVESVTSAGIREVFKKVKAISTPNIPIVLTSKGIEQETGLILSDIVIEVFGEEVRPYVSALSGPSYADEVIQGLPTSVVGSAYREATMMDLCETFTTHTLRVYPNPDLRGVAYGGALKNIIAIACGIIEGMGLGQSAKAALMTRGLHEMRKLAGAQGCDPETLNGLSGMGDLIVTCGSLMSRNCRFGYLLAKGYTPEKAKLEIGMVVEGVYSALSALQLSRKLGVAMPITEMVYGITYEGLSPKDALASLMEREIKLEHL